MAPASDHSLSTPTVTAPTRGTADARDGGGVSFSDVEQAADALLVALGIEAPTDHELELVIDALREYGRDLDEQIEYERERLRERTHRVDVLEDQLERACDERDDAFGALERLAK